MRFLIALGIALLMVPAVLMMGLSIVINYDYALTIAGGDKILPAISVLCDVLKHIFLVGTTYCLLRRRWGSAGLFAIALTAPMFWSVVSTTSWWATKAAAVEDIRKAQATVVSSIDQQRATLQGTYKALSDRLARASWRERDQLGRQIEEAQMRLDQLDARRGETKAPQSVEDPAVLAFMRQLGLSNDIVMLVYSVIGKAVILLIMMELSPGLGIAALAAQWPQRSAAPVVAAPIQEKASEPPVERPRLEQQAMPEPVTVIPPKAAARPRPKPKPTIARPMLVTPEVAQILTAPSNRITEAGLQVERWLQVVLQQTGGGHKLGRMMAYSEYAAWCRSRNEAVMVRPQHFAQCLTRRSVVIEGDEYAFPVVGGSDAGQVAGVVSRSS